MSFASSLYDDRQCPVCSKAESFRYGPKLFGSLMRGLLNTGLGWTEILNQPVQAARDKEGMAAGLGRAPGRAVTRTARGVKELLTFWKAPDPTGERASQSAYDCTLGSLGMTAR